MIAAERTWVWRQQPYSGVGFSVPSVITNTDRESRGVGGSCVTSCRSNEARSGKQKALMTSTRPMSRDGGYTEISSGLACSSASFLRPHATSHLRYLSDPRGVSCGATRVPVH